LRVLAATLSSSEKQREDLVVAAEARREEAARAALMLRVGLAGALDGARDAREQRDRQGQLASEQEWLVQSTTKELQVAQARLEEAEDEIERLSAELQREDDWRDHKTKELLEEQARIQEQARI
jgi:hypothetical protein